MPKRVCVFVDGENLRHSLVDLFPKEFNPADYLPKNADWGALFDELSKRAIAPDCERVRAYWYVVQHLDFFPYGLHRIRGRPDELQRVISKHETLRLQLEKLNGELLANRMNEVADELEARQERMRNRFERWNAIHSAIAQRCLRIPAELTRLCPGEI